MKRILAVVALVAALVVAPPVVAEAQNTFKVTTVGTWTVIASGDNDAIWRLQQSLAQRFAPYSVEYLNVEAHQSPVQSVPGATTYDATVEFVVSADALTLSDSLGKVSIKSMGTQMIKAGRITGTREKYDWEVD